MKNPNISDTTEAAENDINILEVKIDPKLR